MRDQDRPATSLISRRLIPALVLIALAMQIGVSWDSYVHPRAALAWQLRSRPAWERTARILLGDDRADFLEFVRQTVPEDGRIILPPQTFGTAFEHIGMMQYFLIPRDIHNCGRNEIEACVRRATGENTYILAPDYFPPRELGSETRRYIAFDDERGVFAPP